jgi:hypothetical protein
MSGIEVSLEHVVPRNTASVWAFVVEEFFTNHPKWDLAITECRRLDGNAAPIQKGTRGLEVRSFGGKQSAEFEVTELERQQRFAFRNTTGPFELNRVYTFEPDGGATRLTFSFQMAPKGAMKVLFPLFRGTIRRQVETNIGRLVQLLSSTST